MRRHSLMSLIDCVRSCINMAVAGDSRNNTILINFANIKLTTFPPHHNGPCYSPECLHFEPPDVFVTFAIDMPHPCPPRHPSTCLFSSSQPCLATSALGRGATQPQPNMSFPSKSLPGSRPVILQDPLRGCHAPLHTSIPIRFPYPLTSIPPSMHTRYARQL